MPLWASGYRNLLPNRRRMMEAGSGSGGSYADKVLGYNPIAYWMLAETSGTAAVCQVNAAQNGTYARNVTTMGTGDGIGDGNTAPIFDGASDQVNIFSATLNAAYDGAEGTFMTWAKVLNVGVWTDGAQRYIWRTDSNDGTVLMLHRKDANNQARWIRTVAGNDIITKAGLTTTSWMNFALTWSETADEIIGYYNGSQNGAAVSGIGNWPGGIQNGGSAIGADSAPGGGDIWSGYLAHAVIFDTPLSGPQISALATV